MDVVLAKKWTAKQSIALANIPAKSSYSTTSLAEATDPAGGGTARTSIVPSTKPTSRCATSDTFGSLASCATVVSGLADYAARKPRADLGTYSALAASVDSERARTKTRAEV